MSNTEMGKAANARLKQACAHAATIDLLLTELKRGAKIETKMPKLRILYAGLGQALHEYNAYHNAANTGK